MSLTLSTTCTVQNMLTYLSIPDCTVGCFFFRTWCNLHWTDTCSIRQQFRIKWFSFILRHRFARGWTGPGKATPIHPVTSHDRFWKLSLQKRWLFVWCTDEIRLFWSFPSFSHKHDDWWLLIFLIHSPKQHENLDFFTTPLLLCLTHKTPNGRRLRNLCRLAGIEL